MGDPGFDLVAGGHIDIAFAVHEVLAFHDAVNLGANVHEDGVVGHFDDRALHLLTGLNAHLGVFLAGQHVGKAFHVLFGSSGFLLRGQFFTHVLYLLETRVCFS